MGLSLEYIIADIRNIATSGSNPDNFRIEDAQISFWIDEIRSMLISQALQKRQDISDIWLQRIPCMSLIEVDKAECCEIITNCKILRTKDTLPSTIEINGDNTIIRVLKPNGESISKVNMAEARYTQYNKYTKDTTKWYLKNSYIYIIDDPMLETITPYLLAETPSDLANYTDCSGIVCYNYSMDYPCSKKMAETITNIVLKTKVYPFIQLPQDSTNDDSNKFDSPTNTKGL